VTFWLSLVVPVVVGKLVAVAVLVVTELAQELLAVEAVLKPHYP
jgi:hypothetical protein